MIWNRQTRVLEQKVTLSPLPHIFEFADCDIDGNLQICQIDTPGRHHVRSYVFPFDVPFTILSKIGQALEAMPQVVHFRNEPRRLAVTLRYRQLMDPFISADIEAAIRKAFGGAKLVFKHPKVLKQA